MMFKLNSKLYRMALDDIECTEQGLLRASVIVSDLKNLAKYNHEQFLKQLDNYHFIREEQLEAKFFNHYIDAFLNAKRITLAPCTIKNYENKILTHIVPRFANDAVDKN